MSTILWHKVHSYCCATNTTIHLQVLYFKTSNSKIQWNKNNRDIFQEYLRLKIGANLYNSLKR